MTDKIKVRCAHKNDRYKVEIPDGIGKKFCAPCGKYFFYDKDGNTFKEDPTKEKKEDKKEETTTEKKENTTPDKTDEKTSSPPEAPKEDADKKDDDKASEGDATKTEEKK